MEKKSQIKALQSKKGQGQPMQKSKVVKPKTFGVKTRLKNVPMKQKAAKAKSRPAPIPEPGYAMYSTDSEEVFTITKEKDACSKVLTMLREKRRVEADLKRAGTETFPVGNQVSGDAGKTSGKDNSTRSPIVIPCVTNDDFHPSPGHVTAMSILAGGKTPFNDRLASSTPDPDRPQIIPERDTNSTHKVTKGNIGVVGMSSETKEDRFQNDVDSQFYSSHKYGQGVPLSNADTYFTSSHGFTTSNEPQNLHEPANFERRDSDIGAFKAYIPRDSTGFVPLRGMGNTPELIGVSVTPGNNNQSGSSGDKSKSLLQSSQNTGNSSGTEYIYLPRPAGNSELQDRNVPQGFQFQNGLYQIRPLGPMTSGGPGQEREIHGAQLVPVTFPDSAQPTNLGSDPLSHKNYAWEIPERDNEEKTKFPRSVPEVLEAAPDTLSTIDGSVSGTHTMETLTPRSTVTESTNTFTAAGHPTLQKVKVKDGKNNSEKQKSSSDDSSKNTGKTSSFQTQCSQYSISNSIPVDSISPLYHLVNTDKGKELVPVSLVHYPSYLHIPGTVHHEGQGQSEHQSQVKGENKGQSQGQQHAGLVPVYTVPNEMSGLQEQSLSSAVTSRPSDQTTSGAVPQNDVGQPNPWSRVRLDAGMKRLRYLLGELRECGNINKDVEVGRLVKEVEKTLDGIPQLSATFSLQSEIDLALQPLRSENAQLRRKLRLANQNSRDQGQEKEKGTASIDFDVLHLQASNAALQKQVKEDMEDKVRLAAEVTDQLNQIQKMKIERNKLLAALSEKETDELKIKQECLVDAQKFRKEVELMNRQIEAIQLQQQASDQENHILQITLQQRDSEINRLQQRDTEINRLQDMIQAIKDGVNELIQELDQSQAADRSFTSNTSFGLQKLLRVLGGAEQQPIEPLRSILTPPRRQNAHRVGIRGNPVKTLRFDPQEVESTQEYQPSKLTEQALASHNRSLEREHDKQRGGNSDTEVDPTQEEYLGRRGRLHQRQRTRSTSPHGQRESKQSYHRRALSSSPRRVDRLSLIASDVRDEDGSLADSFSGAVQQSRNISDRKYQRSDVPRGDSGFNDNRLGIQRLRSWGQQTNIESNRSDADQSRYSVTDYFKKYHTNLANDDSYKAGPNLESRLYSGHHRALSQPARAVQSHRNESLPSATDRRPPINYTKPVTNTGQFKHETSGTVFSARSRPKVMSPQDRLFQGTTLDNSISAIDDDNFSSVSSSGKTLSSSSTTVTEKTFRKGIATLDANILKLQLALQRTKSMLS